MRMIDRWIGFAMVTQILEQICLRWMIKLNQQSKYDMDVDLYPRGCSRHGRRHWASPSAMHAFDAGDHPPDNTRRTNLNQIELAA